MSLAASVAILALAFLAVAVQGTWGAGSAAPSRPDPEPAADLSAGDSLCSDEDVERLPYVDHADDLSMRFRIPRYFDARKRWRFCPSIRSIREQSNCKAYYAMAAASVLSDRICIASRGRKRPELSAQHLLSCCTRCGTCQAGGCICMSWQFAHEHGLVTGGSYNSSRGCYPYEARPCGDRPGQLGCPAELPTASACRESACTNAGYRTPFAKDVHRAGAPYRVANTTSAIQAEILRHGPVSALMRYDNKFLRYSGGIYRRDDSDLIAATTLRVIGWGHTRRHGAYWLAANSWGVEWGEKGTVRIAMRADNFINNHVQAAHPDFHHL